MESAGPLGLIAGEGAFPFLVARGAAAAGRTVICAGLRGSVDPALASEVSVYREVGVLQIGRWINVLRAHGVTQAIMVGRVGKSAMHRRGKWLRYVPDWRTLRVYYTRVRKDKRDHAVLLAVADELAREGITLMDSTTFTKDHMASPGVMGRHAPTPAQTADAEFGFRLCRMISSEDIGQALALVDKDVIAVEAVEGTDRMIERAGNFCKGRKWVLVKVANANRDLRIDVPSIGLQTIEKLKSAGCGCLVLEAAQTMMLEKEKVIAAADRAGIVLLGMSEPK
jgi:DUF1009 family protein